MHGLRVKHKQALESCGTMKTVRECLEALVSKNENMSGGRTSAHALSSLDGLGQFAS